MVIILSTWNLFVFLLIGKVTFGSKTKAFPKPIVVIVKPYMQASWIWQVEICSEFGLWKDMDLKWGLTLSEFYATDPKKLLRFDSPLILSDGEVTYCKYVVDFQKCLQTNETTGTTRNIRKVQIFSTPEAMAMHDDD